MNTAGTVGTNIGWQIIFNPWGSFCRAAQPGSCFRLATSIALAAPGKPVERGHFPVASCFLPSRWQTASSLSTKAGLFLGVCGDRRRVWGTERIGFYDQHRDNGTTEGHRS